MGKFFQYDYSLSAPRLMSCRQVNYANRRKAELIAALGGCCWGCGATSQLEIDHPEGRNYKPSKLSFAHRIITYWREHEQKLVRVLCSTCNADRRYNGVTLSHPGAAPETCAEDPLVPF